MMARQCRKNPGSLCVYSECYFGGPCHLQGAVIDAAEAEYNSWFPVPMTVPGYCGKCGRQFRLDGLCVECDAVYAAAGVPVGYVLCRHCGHTVKNRECSEAESKNCTAMHRPHDAGVIGTLKEQPTADEVMALAMTCSGELHDGDLTLSKVQLYGFARRLLAAYGVGEVQK
jgi:hypothetical protein